MSKGTQLWPGDRMRSFFRAHVRRETSLDEASADRLAEALTRAVNRMLVWDGTNADAAPAAAAPVAKAAEAAPSRKVANDETERAPAATFNPYIFSALVLLAKGGRDGLARRLSEIKTAENLRALAEAQHLGIEPTLKRTDDIRRAIIAATERRLADRKAAAS